MEKILKKYILLNKDIGQSNCTFHLQWYQGLSQRRCSLKFILHFEYSSLKFCNGVIYPVLMSVFSFTMQDSVTWKYTLCIFIEQLYPAVKARYHTMSC